ncbi:MAG TPA: TIGR03790 family protein, partial [Opitutaceae bacterium]
MSCSVCAAAPGGQVIVVANSTVPSSVDVARHYAAARAVPKDNVIALPMPAAETITWAEFVSDIWQPLEDQLVGRGWIDAIPMDLRDGVGRRQYAVSGHHIAAIVLCRGVPLRIVNEPKLFSEVKPLTDHGQFRTNQGAVDSELSLLAQPGYPINAAVPNPLYEVEHPSAILLAQVVKVTRLDGPTPSDAMALVDHAIEAERTGLLGRAYVDMAGPSEMGNRWLAAAEKTIESEGFDMTVGQGPAIFPISSRFDVPALYFGWYAQDLKGPFELPGFQFPPGAIAVHIHSFSAHTLRSATEGWCGPLIARGVTATLGNVFEPYLEYLHRPDLFMAALARGEDLADAAYYALPML